MIEIIPAIDIIDGKCVRLTQGDYSQRTDYGADPLEMALRFEDHGIKRLHMVDLDGAKKGRVINYRQIEKVATRSSLVIDVGGGLKTRDDLRIVFESGADMATGGSVAVKDPDQFAGWLEEYSPERIILGSDFSKGRIAVSGWTEESEHKLLPFIQDWAERGITKTICTDVSKDGLLQGPSVETYIEIRDTLPDLYLIASGGVSDMKDIEKLEMQSIPAVIIGKAIYEGRINLKDLEKYNISY